MGAATVSVSTTVTAVTTVGLPGFPITVKNQGPATVFLDLQPNAGSSSVTADQSSTGGFPLEPGESWTNPVYYGSTAPYAGTYYTVYGITAEGTAYVTAIG